MQTFRFKSIIRSALFFGILMFVAATPFTQGGENKSCLAYEPATVTLSGKLSRRPVFDASGRRQTIWVIKLAEPVCVNADPANEMNAAVGRVSEIQLVFTAEQVRRYRALLNQKVQLKGRLFAAHTQHHFTDVLMMVGEAKKK